MLGTLCEITKLHPLICINTNLIKLICELNFENTNSQILTHQSLLGQVNEKFVGFGIKYDDVMMCFTNPLCIDNPILAVDLEQNELNLSMSENKVVTFEGAVNAKKIPKALKALFKF